MKKTLAILLFALTPFTAFASAHNYVCSDFNIVSGGFTCTTATISVNGTFGYVNDGTPTYSLPIGTYYLVATYNGTGTLSVAGSNDASYNTDFSTSPNGLQFSVTASGGGLALTTKTPYFNGTLSNICVDNDNTSCGEIKVATSTAHAFTEIFGDLATSTAIQNLVIADIPNLDLFMAFTSFYMVMFGVMFFFRKRV